jgi:hypothetical protein
MKIFDSTREAISMLEAGWTIQYVPWKDKIQWRTPDGISCENWCSTSLDIPPYDAVLYAREQGHIKNESNSN